MNSEIMNPTITVGVFAAAAIVMLLASFVHLAKAKGARDAFLWLLFVPMPFTKAMYMFILATIAIHSERPFPSVWLWGAALAFCAVICVQWAIAGRRIGNERLSAILPMQTLKLRGGSSMCGAICRSSCLCRLSCAPLSRLLLSWPWSQR